MKITDIEIIPIAPRLAKRYAHRKVDLYGIDARVVYKVHTDNGLIGYGDVRVRPNADFPRSSVEPLIGRDPFDFLHNNLGAALGGALYDVMGKYLEVPAYKLMGQKVRDAVSVAAWTRPASPQDFRSEIARAAAQGYTIFKMHSCSYHDVIEQTRLAAEAAPPGFKIHWDFNGNRTLGAALPLVKELEKNHPVVGYIEDPLRKSDFDSWRRLREQSNLPIIMHGGPLGGAQEMLSGVADTYMIGGNIGETLTTGFMFSKVNIRTLIQITGGTLTKALALHMAAVLPSCTGHNIDLDDQYEEDITRSRIPVVEGYSPVPQEPGLGYEVDEEALARLAAQKITERPRYVGVLHMPGGHTFYGPSYVSPEGEEGSVHGFSSELWEDDGSKEFAEVYERTRREGKFLAR